MSGLISHQQLLNAKKVLYMTHLAIGDFVYQGVWLSALKAKYPHLTIDIWFDDCRRSPHEWAGGRNQILTEWINAIGDFGDIYPIVSNIAEREQYITKAQQQNYDVIVFVGKNRSTQYAKLARTISKQALSVATTSGANFFSNWLYFNKLDGVISYDDIADSTQHITELYAECFKQLLGLTTSDLVSGYTQLMIQPEEKYTQQAQQLIDDLTGKDNTKLICFMNHLSTADKKDYPWAQLKTVMLTLAQLYPQVVFIINTPPNKLMSVQQDVEADKELLALKIQVFTALENFFQLPALMAKCDFCLSVDTATAHLAVSMKVPQVTIMASDFKLWQPLGDSLILEGTGKASSVATDTVIDACKIQLSKCIK
ncbi:glycosyltransferase family 9 protein [Shewanella sp. HL-SH8]|uniref:glycosyltransferase family 9 protein n=1 Tax=Shewanella sp. HL-SH8 TaxID=3436242 RepID=UPI003EB976DA